MSRNGLKQNNQWISLSAENTVQIGRDIGRALTPNSVICLDGELGAGKTTLIKGIVQEVTGLPSDDVVSPTFVYLTPYRGLSGLTLYHFDLYRLKGIEDFLALGLEEYLAAGGVCCIEWSCRIDSFLPVGTKRIHLTHLGLEKRSISYA